MPIPRIAIVGRPNVGKSSLMNMIAGSKVSIVDPTPGVTRDRVSAIVDLQAPDGGPAKPAEFIDTGGFGVYVADGERYDEVGEDLTKLTGSIEEQIAQAITNSDLVLFVLDAQAGVTPHDEEISRLLREGKLGAGKAPVKAKSDKSKTDGKTKKAPKPARPPIRVVANKVDGPKWESHGQEIAGLGFGEPLLVSAKNNYMRRDFLESIYGLLPKPKDKPEKSADLMLAIVGKRNAGKSTLVNTLAGEPRVIVSEIAGTTRDAIDVRFELDGKSLVAIDTAGVRKGRSLQNMVEHFALDRAKWAVERADVVILLIDATVKLSQVDEQVAMFAQKAHKPAMIVVNKWDLADGKPNRKGVPVTTDDFEEYLRKELKGLSYAPICFISAKSGENVRDTVQLAFELNEQSCTRVTTGKLNRLIRGILEMRSPTDEKGTQAKVYYVAQTGTNPPTVTLVVNHPELFRPSYLRFLTNRFREELPFSEVPIRIIVRARKTREGDLADNAEAAVGKIGGVRKKFVGRRPVGGDLSETELSAVQLDELSDVAEEYFDD